MTEPLVVLITAPNIETARQLAQALVSLKLCACVNILPGIESIYPWEGEIQQDQETLLIAKTRAEKFEQVAETIRALHPYQLPEIIALPIVRGFAPYLRWLEENS